MKTLDKPTCAVSAHEKIESFSPVKDERFVDAMAVGQFARQGDVYLIKIQEIDPELKPTQNRQLAPGVTQGSRHTVSEDVKVFAPKVPNKRRDTGFGVAIVGPQIESRKHFTVAHPEHADISLPPGCYEVVYQFDQATGKRTLD